MVYLRVLISGFEIATFSGNCEVPRVYRALIPEDGSQMTHGSTEKN